MPGSCCAALLSVKVRGQRLQRSRGCTHRLVLGFATAKVKQLEAIRAVTADFDAASVGAVAESVCAHQAAIVVASAELAPAV